VCCRSSSPVESAGRLANQPVGHPTVFTKNHGRLLEVAESEKHELGNAVPILTNKNDARRRGSDSGADHCNRCRVRAAKVARLRRAGHAEHLPGAIGRRLACLSACSVLLRLRQLRQRPKRAGNGVASADCSGQSAAESLEKFNSTRNTRYFGCAGVPRVDERSGCPV
jgi:hypothetical protein